MAARSDILRLTIDVDAKKGTATVRKFGDEVKRTGKKVKPAAAATAKFGKLFKGGLAALGIGLTVQALKNLTVAMIEFIKAGDKVSQLERSFGVLTKRVGASADVMISKMRPAARGLIDDMELMRQANQAILLGLPATSNQMAAFTDAAIVLSRATGIDAKMGLESLISGIGRMEKELLDNLGITVRADEANKAYAASLGKTAAQMTEAERKAAFLAATMKAIDVATEGLSATVFTAGEKIKQLETNWTNASGAIGKALNESTAITGIFNAALIPAIIELNTAVLAVEIAFAKLDKTARFFGDVFKVLTGQDFTEDRGVVGAAVRARIVAKEARDELALLSQEALDAMEAPLGDATPVGAPQPLNQEDPLAGLIGLPDTGAFGDLQDKNEQLAELTRQFTNFTVASQGSDISLRSFAEAQRIFGEAAADLIESGAVGDINNAFLEQIVLIEQVARAEEKAADEKEKQELARMERLREREALERAIASASINILKAAFGETKEIAIAEAVINTALGATKAFGQGGFFGFAMAAAVVAAGLVQIQRIRSSNPGGGGGVSAPSGGSEAAALQKSGGGGGASRNVQVFIEGQGFIQDPELLIRTIRESISDDATSRA